MVFRVMIGFKADLEEWLSGVAADVHLKDASFIYKIVSTKNDKYDYLLCIDSDTLDQAHKRGVWLCSVVKKEKEIELLYWIKEIKEGMIYENKIGYRS